MASQETMDFVKNIIKNILSKWESLPLDMRDKMRDELMSVFITFVGENKTTLKDKQIVGIHLCWFLMLLFIDTTDHILHNT